jgi:hypothetical protein
MTFIGDMPIDLQMELTKIKFKPTLEEIKKHKERIPLLAESSSYATMKYLKKRPPMVLTQNRQPNFLRLPK